LASDPEASRPKIRRPTL